MGRPAKGRGRRASTTVYLDEHQLAALREVSEQLGQPMAVGVRRGVDLVIDELRAKRELLKRHKAGVRSVKWRTDDYKTTTIDDDGVS